MKRLWKIILYCGKGYLMAAAVIVVLQRFFLYHPSSTWLAQPEQYHAAAVTYTTQDGIALTSWYCAPQEGKPVFVMFHGNAGNLSMRGFKQGFFCRQGYGFLLAEYRGYGGNAGSPTENGLYSDARAALSWLIHDQKIDVGSVIIYGESIGTGVASQMALEYKDAKALVLEAPLTSVPDMVGSVMPWMRPFRFMVLDDYDNLAKAPYFTMPAIVLQGRDDEVIPVEKGKAVFSALGGIPKKLTILKGGRHNDLTNFGLLEEIQKFVKGV